MAARKRKVRSKRELDIVVSFPPELQEINEKQQKALDALAAAFNTRVIYSMDVKSDVMVKVEKR